MTREPSTKSHRLPFVIGAALSVSMMVLTACSGNDKATPPSGGGDTVAVPAMSTITPMKVCDLIDLKPLATTLMSPGYEQDPTDVPTGSGVDPAGPSCVAQLNLPPIENMAGKQETVIPARLIVGVIPFDTATAAAETFEKRMKETEDIEGHTSEELPGDWTTARVATADLDVESVLQALIQQDDYLVRIYLQVTSDVGMKGQFTFTTEAVKKDVVDLATALHSTVAAEVAK